MQAVRGSLVGGFLKDAAWPRGGEGGVGSKPSCKLGDTEIKVTRLQTLNTVFSFLPISGSLHTCIHLLQFTSTLHTSHNLHTTSPDTITPK